MTKERLLEAIDISEVIARIHNNQSDQMNLRYGGYGSIGFCIDSISLLEYAVSGKSKQFPLTLNGIWRERLDKQANQILKTTNQLSDRTASAIERYRGALENCHGTSTSEPLRKTTHCGDFVKASHARDPLRQSKDLKKLKQRSHKKLKDYLNIKKGLAKKRTH